MRVYHFAVYSSIKYNQSRAALSSSPYIWFENYVSKTTYDCLHHNFQRTKVRVHFEGLRDPPPPTRRYPRGPMTTSYAGHYD